MPIAIPRWRGGRMGVSHHLKAGKGELMMTISFIFYANGTVLLAVGDDGNL